MAYRRPGYSDGARKVPDCYVNDSPNHPWSFSGTDPVTGAIFWSFIQLSWEKPC